VTCPGGLGESARDRTLLYAPGCSWMCSSVLDITECARVCLVCVTCPGGLGESARDRTLLYAPGCARVCWPLLNARGCVWCA